MYFVDLQKAFDRVMRKVVALVMRMKGIPEAVVRAEQPALRCKDKSESWNAFI